MSDHDKTRELMARLRRHYIKPGQPFSGGIFVPECGLNGGTGSRIDAAYVGFTSTSGRMLIGHEVKVSMADWRKELDTPGKADLWADNCHAWYIVVPNEMADKVLPHLPADWGLMTPSTRTKTRMDIKVKAPVKRDLTPSWLITRSLMARLDTLQVGQIDSIRRTARDEAMQEWEARQAERPDRPRLTSREQQGLEQLRTLEEALGVTLDSHDYGRSTSVETFAKALRLVKAERELPRRLRAFDHVQGAADALDVILEELRDARKEWLDE